MIFSPFLSSIAAIMVLYNLLLVLRRGLRFSVAFESVVALSSVSILVLFKRRFI